MLEMYTKRHIEYISNQALIENKILVIIGARQTGKSTLAGQLLSSIDENDKLTLNLDDPFLRDRLLSEEGLLLRLIEEKAQRPWSAISQFHLLVDEAQKAPAIFEIIKAMYDSNKQRLKIILTGSSALGIHNPVAETLAGRCQIVQLYPFTLSEGFAHQYRSDPSQSPIVAIMPKIINASFTKQDFNTLSEHSRWQTSKRRNFVDDHLRFPLFPEPSDNLQPETWIRDYLATYLEKDIQSLAAVGNLALFRACIQQLAARTGSTLKWETMAQEIGTSSITLRKYIGLLEQTLNTIRLNPFVHNPVKRIIKAPKQYIIDPGLVWGLRGYEDLRLLKASGMLGNYMELVAISEIAKWCSFEPTAPTLSFWSKTNVSEVDLIVSNRGYHIPFEIKLGQQMKKSWFAGLDAFDKDHRQLKLKIPYRFIIYLGEAKQLDQRTYLLPLWACT
jgi:predicted AAA+ superfamily ATPase